MNGPRQRLDELDAALAESEFDARGYLDLARRIRDYVDGYARLETDLLEAVWIPVPSHLLELDLPEDLLEAAEFVAARERERLDLPPGAVGNVMEILDREGLKVYRAVFPAGGLEGIFLFDPEAGPCLVVDEALGPLQSNRVFARLYAHYLLDHDPYCIRLVGSGAPEDGAGARAEAFAAAFLIDRAGLDAFLAAGRGESIETDPRLLTQLAVYFEVDPRTLLARLLALGLVEASAVPSLLGKIDAAACGVSWTGFSRVSERKRRLALEAFARREIGLQELADLIESNREDASRLAARFRLEPEPENGSSPADRKGKP